MITSTASAMASDYELSDKETEFKHMDKDRLVHVGDHRCYRVHRHADTGEYWVSCMGDFVSHHVEDPLPKH